MTKARVAYRILGLLGLALAAGSGPALAAPAAEPPVWETKTIRDARGRLESCAIVRAFDDASILSFALSRERDFFMVVSNPDLHLPSGWGGMAHYAIDDGLEFRAYAEAVGGSLIVDLPESAALQVMLGDGSWLYIGELGDRGYALDGLKVGLRSLGKCVDQAMAAEAGAGAKPKETAAAPEPAKPAAATTPVPAQAQTSPPVPAAPTPAPPAPSAAAVVEADLGTYDFEETARTDWPHLQRRLSPLLNNREPVIRPRIRSRDGRVFYSLRVGGFPDRAAAERFCNAVEAKKQECTAR